MANAEARLRLIVEAVANTSGLNGLFGQLNGLGKNNPFAGFTSVDMVSAFSNLTTSASTAKGKLVEVRTAAGDVARTMEVELTNKTKSATNAMSAFHGELKKTSDQAPHTTQTLNDFAAKFAFWMSIQQASQAIKNAGMQIWSFLMSGMEDAADKEAAIVRMIQGALVNNPDVVKTLDAGGESAWNKFREGFEKSANKVAIEIGLNTTFSDNQVAQGMAILAQAGVDVDDILNGVAESMANVAMIGNTDIPTAARGMIAIYNQFGDRLEEQFGHIEDAGARTRAEYQYVSDVITNAMLSSGMTFNELTTALSYAGSASAMAGQSFGDTAAVLALFAKNGINGSKAGTGLRRIITNLTPTTEKAEEAVRQLTKTIGGNADIFYDAEGRMKSLGEVQELLFAAMADKSPQEQVFLMKEIFGQYAIGQALILATSDEFGNLTERINQNGTAMRQVNSIMDSTAGINDRSTEATRTLGETIGYVLNQYLNPFKISYADLIERYVMNTPGPIQGVVSVLLALVGSFAVLIGTIGSAVAGWKLFSLGLSMAGVSIGSVVAVAGTIIGVIAGIAAVAALVYLAWTENWGGFRDFTIAVWDEVKAVFNAAVAEITAWWNELAPTAAQAWENVKVAFNDVVEWIYTYLMPIFQVAWDGLVMVLTVAWETMKGVLKGAWEVFSGIFQTFIALIAGDWDVFFAGLQRIFDGFVNIFTSLWNGFWTLLFNLVEMSLGWISEKFGLDLNALTTLFEGWKAIFFVVFDTFWGALKTVFSAFLSILRGDWQGALDDIKKFIEERKEAISQAFQSVVDGIKAIWTTLVDSAKNWGANLMQNLIDGISSKIQAVKNKAKEVAETVKDFLGFSSPTKEGPGSTADRWMPNLMSMLADQLTSSRPMLQRALDGVAMDIGAGVNGVPLSGGVPSSNRSTVVNVTVNYNGNGNRSDVDAFAKAVGRQVAMVST